MKTYTGYRFGDDPGGQVRVHCDDGSDYPLKLRHDLRMHADGHEWGYAGSGPAQLALDLAADVLGEGDDDRARQVYQKLKFRLVGRLPRDGWVLTEQALREVIDDIERQRGEGPQR